MCLPLALESLKHSLSASTLSLWLLSGCAEPVGNQLEQVQQSGELQVVTRNTPSTYYIGQDGAAGFEYDLAQRFAEHLEVELVMRPVSTLDELFTLVEAEEVHLAAAGLTITPERETMLSFAQPYHWIEEHVVYRVNAYLPTRPLDLNKGHLEIVANSSHHQRLSQLSEQYPSLNWIENTELDSIELFELVREEIIDFTIADSNELALHRQFYPELAVAFDLGDPQPLAWAFKQQPDTSLRDAANQFLQQMELSGDLQALLEYHYGHLQRFNYVDNRAFLRHVKRRLPRYQGLFKQEASQDWSWQLLAAVAYQESHWDADARSPTGVRGLMMLTRNTAKDMGVSNRLDPAQSVYGGAKYLRQLLKRFADIPMPDRLWFSLAAYNVGYGHVRDAQGIASSLGQDASRWTHVKDTLPLLRRPTWYQRTRYGYARGNEPVQYVDNIRRYYGVLQWLTEEPGPPPPSSATPLPTLNSDSSL